MAIVVYLATSTLMNRVTWTFLCSSSLFENEVEEPESGTVDSEPYQYEPVASDASSESDGEDVDSDGDEEERSRLSNTD